LNFRCWPSAIAETWVAAASRAGGFGVLGATTHSPDSIEQELKWIDDHVDGKPYGLDVLIPENISTLGEKDVTWRSLESRVSPQHRAFTRDLLKKYGIELATTEVPADQPQPFDGQLALEVLEGVVPASDRPDRQCAWRAAKADDRDGQEAWRTGGRPWSAPRKHAIRQVAAGVDILVVQGTEAGGHCGEVSTMVLVPEVIKAIRADARCAGCWPRGGIMTGRQMAACMAMGAAGVWTGSVWAGHGGIRGHRNFSREDDRRLVARRRPLQGAAPASRPRQLRSVWTDAWDRDPSFSRRTADAAAEHPQAATPSVRSTAPPAAGNAKARDLVSYFVGQGVGLIDSVKIRRRRGAGIQGGVCRGGGASQCAGGRMIAIASQGRAMPSKHHLSTSSRGAQRR